MRPTRKVNPFGEETDWDALYLAVEKAVEDICEYHDLPAVIWALSALVWRNLREWPDTGSRDLSTIAQILILSDWPEVDPVKTARMKPLLEAISCIPDRRHQAAVVLNHIQALALLAPLDHPSKSFDMHKRNIDRLGLDKPPRKKLI